MLPPMALFDFFSAGRGGRGAGVPSGPPPARRAPQAHPGLHLAVTTGLPGDHEYVILARLGLEAGALYVASLAVDRAAQGDRVVFRTAGYEVVRGHHNAALDRAVWDAAAREAAHRRGTFSPRASDRTPRLVDPPPPDPSAKP